MKAFLDSSGLILTSWHDVTIAGSIVALITFALGIYTGYQLKIQMEKRAARKAREAEEAEHGGPRQHP